MAIVVTHEGARARAIDLPWLEKEDGISDSDRIVLSHEGWRAVVDGEAAILEALRRKLLVGIYVSGPEFIAVVGHPDGRPDLGSVVTGLGDVERVTRRIRSLSLRAIILGFWTDEHGNVAEISTMPTAPHGAQRVAASPTARESRFSESS